MLKNLLYFLVLTIWLVPGVALAADFSGKFTVTINVEQGGGLGTAEGAKIDCSSKKAALDKCRSAFSAMNNDDDAGKTGGSNCLASFGTDCFKDGEVVKTGGITKSGSCQPEQKAYDECQAKAAAAAVSDMLAGGSDTKGKSDSVMSDSGGDSDSSGGGSDSDGGGSSSNAEGSGGSSGGGPGMGGTDAMTGGESKCPGGTAFCGPGVKAGSDLTKASIDKSVHTGFDLKKLMIGWTKFLLSLASVAAVIALIYAGFLYVTAFGEDGRMDKAKNIILWVVFGSILIMGSFAIVNSLIKGIA